MTLRLPKDVKVGPEGFTPATVALCYFAFASTWVLLSDFGVTWLSSNMQVMVLANTGKGWVFVVVTAAWLYAYLARLRGKVTNAVAISHSFVAWRAGLFDSFPRPLLVCDGEGEIVDANHASDSFFGDPDTKSATSFFDLVALDDRVKVKSAFNIALSGNFQDFQCGLLAGDGLRSELLHLAPLVGAHGGVGSILVAVTDGVVELPAGGAGGSDRDNGIEETFIGIAAIVGARDLYTYGHQFRVRDLCRAIGGRMGLEPDRLSGLLFAAGVHDVGKIAVPAEILARPARLTADERHLIETHATIGYEILSKIRFHRPIAEIVYQHHERLDGSGYPRHLVGESILLEARILGVADTIEAMTSHRPYRAGLGIAAALAEIRAGAGKRYDPNVVAACIEVFEKGKFEFRDYKP